MDVRRLAATGVLVATCGLAGVSVASPALAVCDAYSGGCPSAPPGGGGSTPIDGGNENPGSGTSTPTGGSTSNPSTLPFTGGELILMTAIGAGALAGGTALVVAGRRRGASPA